MMPVIPCSTSRIALIPGTPFTVTNSNGSTKCSLSRKPGKHASPSQRLVLPFPASVKSLPYYKSCHHDLVRGRTMHEVSATGTDLAVGEAETPAISEETSDGASENNTSSPHSNASTAAAQPKRARPGRRTEMPPIKNEDLVPGATFTGKVRSIQPFGAFIDFGAFTDGLVHVSRLSDSFVKDVGDVVSVGQEVKVRLIEANTETGRISLSMREDDPSSSPQQRRDTSSAASGGDKPRPARRNTQRTGQKRDEKSSKFAIGQQLEGTVKNLARSGAFISLPEGEEGFLPSSEEATEGFVNIMGGSKLEVGQQVSVRVLRINRGQATLTMKKEVDNKNIGGLLGQGVIHSATNPFMLAFRKNEDIATFLDEREKVQKEAETTSVVDELKQEDNVSDAQSETSEESLVGVSSFVEQTVIDAVALEVNPESSLLQVESTVQTIPDKAIEEQENVAVDIAIADQKVEEQPLAEAEESDVKSSLSDEIASEASLSEAPVNESIAIPVVDNEIVAPASEGNDSIVNTDEVQNQAIAEVPEEVEDNATTSASLVENEKQESAPGRNGTFLGICAFLTASAISPALVKQLREETGAGMMDCKNALSETGGDIIKAQEFLRTKGLASADKKASRVTAEGRIGSYIHDNRIGVLIEVNCETDFVSRGEIFKELVDDLSMQVAACPQVQYVAKEDVAEEFVSKEKKIEMQKEDLLSKPEQIRAKIVEGRIQKRLDELALLEQPYIKNDKVVVKDWLKQTIATVGENMKVKRFVRYNLGEGLEKKNQDFAAEVAAQTAARSAPAPPKEQPPVTEVQEEVQKAPAAPVSAALVKQLREETGAGMMDCKKALSETGGDLEKAQEYLRKKGLSSADKKSSRIAAEGRIGSYIHDSRIGVLIEVNCETDFVGRSEEFKELVNDLAMQVVACPQVQFVSVEDVPESFVLKEKELEMQREDLQSKPENIREKIVEGRISKRMGELALLEQPFIKDDKLLVKDLVKQTIATLGENIKVRRFIKFTLGEAIEDAKPQSETEA
ncbi:Polyprotein of EF-Ts, chloroplastic [Linum perenne]